MAGTDEAIKATQASNVVNKGINEKFLAMPSEWIHSIMEVKRRNEQMTEIPLTATRKYSPTRFDQHHQHEREGHLGKTYISSRRANEVLQSQE